jgi:polyferredoxin
MHSAVLRRLRVAIAAAVFAGLFLALAGVHWLGLEAAGHYLASTQFVPSLLALVTGASFSVAWILIAIAALLVGRVYCSAVCPFGILQDVIARIAAILRRRNAALPYALPLTWIRHLFLWGAVVAIGAGWGSFTIALLDPYSSFGRIVSIIFRPLIGLADRAVGGAAKIAGLSWSTHLGTHWGGVGVIGVPAAILSLVVVLVAFRGRLYCNSVCPVGTLLGLFSRWAAFRVAIDKGSCRKCGECLRACKAQCIDLRRGTVDFSRCVACYDCLGVCDNHSVGYRFAWRRNARTAPAPNAASGAFEKPSVPEAVADPQRRTFIATAAVAVAASLAGTKLHAAGNVVAPRSTIDGKDRLTRPICPPGSVSVERFVDRCTACQLCVGACPTNVLQPSFREYGVRGLWKPRLDYATGSCDFDCRRCGEVCPSGAIGLLDLAEKQITRIGVVHFEAAKCVVLASGTACTACSDKCPTKAVRTVPTSSGLQLPTIQPLFCIGCGSCEHVCPARPQKAITVIGRRHHNRARKAADGRATPTSSARVRTPREKLQLTACGGPQSINPNLPADLQR